jgi:hypothetical protein
MRLPHRAQLAHEGWEFAMRGVFDWCFRNRVTGAITIGQWPNPPLWILAAASVLGLLVPAPSPAATVLSVIAGLSLAWWAADEVLRGVNPWRRALGAAVLILQAVRLFA